MARHNKRIPGPFTVNRTIRKKPRKGPRLSKSEYKAKCEEKLKEELEEKARKEKLAEEAKNKGPSKKEQKRLRRREYLVKEGKLVQTDLEVKQLMKHRKQKREDGVVFSIVGIQDEAELRLRFAYDGTAGQGTKYFASSRYYFRFLLAKDGTPVAQILEKAVV
mmetsp:Transcript_55609/g.153939  ORF Transcript_55609/g.153939 Transcript_55609/m.153939 type:complete len:163 (+) Transcript_55609:123-611(+)